MVGVAEVLRNNFSGNYSTLLTNILLKNTSSP